MVAPRAEARPLLLFDVSSGEVLLEHEAGDAWYPASLTKLMTAYLTFESLAKGSLKLDQKLTVPAEVLKIPPSKLGMKPGTTVPVDLALRAMLVYSANDMAFTLAEAQGGHDAFVARMNDAAKQLGMSTTHYVNPHGLFDPGQVSSARDLGVLAAAIISKYPQYQHYFAEPYIQIGKRKLKNRNMLLRQMPDADGMKTGFVCPSGFNLVASATRNGRRLVAVVLGTSTAYARADAAQALLEFGFATPSGKRTETLTSINDLPDPPQNLKEAVCLTGIKTADTSQLTGWGVSFGRVKGIVKADATLTATEAVTGGALEKVPTGLVRVPASKTDYLALAWGLEQQHTVQLCNYLKALNRYCEPLNPESLATFRTIAGKQGKPEPAASRPKKPDPDLGE